MIRFITLLMLIPVLTGCHDMGPGSKAYRAEQQKFETGYFSGDPKLAEQALLERKRTYQKWQARGVAGYSYPHIYGIADARLFMLYSFVGNTQKAEHAYQSATNNMAQLPAREGRQPELVSHDELRRLGEQAESGLPLRWKNK